MKNLSLAFMVVLCLMLAFTPLMSASAEESPACITFKGYTLGGCGVARTLGAWPNPILIGYGKGSGSMALNGYAKATSYQELPYGMDEYFQIYDMAYFTAPGDVRATGLLAVKWFESNKLHQLWVTIYSVPSSQGVFQPETDKFIAGFSPSGSLEGLLSYRGIYMIGSNVQYLSGPIGVWASKGEIPGGPAHEIEYIHVVLIYGEEYYAIHIAWLSEAVSMPISPGETLTVPAATILINDVKLL